MQKKNREMETSAEAHIRHPAFEEEVNEEIQTRNALVKRAGPPLKEAQKKQLTKEERLIKWRILNNVIVISFAFCGIFTSCLAIANLQSSINRKLGIISLSTVYAGMVFSAIFLPSIFIRKFKEKWTITISMLCFTPYIAAQFFPRYYTLVPASIIVGLGSAPMWTAKCKYLMVVGEQYAELVGEKSEVIITRFFGIFFLFFQSSIVLGSFISSTVFSKGVISDSRSQNFLDLCGANFCPDFAFNLTAKAYDNISSDSIQRIQKEENNNKIMVMSTICLVIAFASSLLVVLLVDSLSYFGKKTKSSANKSGLQLLMATLKHLKNPNQMLIIPLTFWIGIEQGFFVADFTASFVTCALGIHMIGYIFICYGVCDAICSVSFTPLVKLVGRVPVFIFGASLNVAMLLVMFLWRLEQNQLSVFFMIAALWGVSDAIWETQINAFYGVIFPGKAESAFSNYRLWKSLGHILSYVFSSSICVSSKLLINFAILLVGMTGYITLELTEFFRRKSSFELGLSVYDI